MAARSRSLRGFSLVELSVVLVIIGLMVGGIMYGRSVIKAAELRKVNNQITQITGAIYAFRTKYSYLPGDMPNATKFWGALDGSTGTTNACSTTVGSGTLTCNGDGDNSLANITYASERLMAWKHMVNAGMVEGNYTGYGDGTLGGYTNSYADINSPKTIREGRVFLSTANSYTAVQQFPFDSGTQLILRIGGVIDNGTPRGPLFTPEEQSNLDSKYDDGKPAYGTMRGAINSYNGCSTTDVATTAAYAVSSSDRLCFIDLFL
ncbi:MAG: type II secretion system protein [Pseudomonadota bacterium]